MTTDRPTGYDSILDALRNLATSRSILPSAVVVMLAEDLAPGHMWTSEAVALDAVRRALGYGADERIWPPGLSIAQSVARLVAILDCIREADRMQAEEEVDRAWASEP